MFEDHSFKLQCNVGANMVASITHDGGVCVKRGLTEDEYIVAIERLMRAAALSESANASGSSRYAKLLCELHGMVFESSIGRFYAGSEICKRVAKAVAQLPA